MAGLHHSEVLIRPIITEKSTDLTPLGQYVFEVAMNANKIQIRDAVERIFDVEVEKVNTHISKPKKRRVYRAQRNIIYGRIGATKRAVVTLVPGDTIDIFGDI
ncbi:MAG: 50S ribosomal protein L23 [Thermomicrobiales bacterium]